MLGFMVHGRAFMTGFDYAAATVAIRPDLAAAHRAYWHTLAGPGSWWTGAERVAIAEESRNAVDCRYCAARRDAPSPYTVPGSHSHSGRVPQRVVDAVHRIVTDQGRITRSWVDDNAAHGLSHEAYVELVGVVVNVLSIDEFHRALGLPLEPLPAPRPGAVSRYRPDVLADDIGFVPTIPPDGAVGRERGLWPGGLAANVLRALSLVPDALRDWLALAAAQYLAVERMGNFGKDDERSIDRLQTELIAARVSAVNECFY
jgi:hypothetical protein